ALLRVLGYVLLARGDLAGAAGRMEEPLALMMKAKEESARLGLSQRALAEGRLAQGRPAGAEWLAGAAAEGMVRASSVNGEAEARAVLALALLAEGRRAEAEEAIVRGRRALGPGEDVHARLAVATAGARVRAAGGQPAEVGA